MSLIHIFKKRNARILTLLVIKEFEQVAKLKRAWNLSLVLLIAQNIPESYCSCLYLTAGQVWWLNELWFKRYIQKCTLSHILILIMTSHYLINYGMCKNTKTWKSFLRNKKKLTCALDDTFWEVMVLKRR